MDFGDRSTGQVAHQVDRVNRSFEEHIVHDGARKSARGDKVAHALVKLAHQLGDGAAGFDLTPGGGDEGVEAAIPADHPPGTAGLGCFFERAGFGQIHARRLFQQRIDSPLQARQSCLGVEVGRGGDDGGLQFFGVEHLLDLGIAVLDRKFFARLLPTFDKGVADSD